MRQSSLKGGYCTPPQRNDPRAMRNHPNIDSLLKLVEEIQDLQKAKDLLEEVWLADMRYGQEVKIPRELSMRLNDYFEVDDSE
jgi:hypothetical protein